MRIFSISATGAAAPSPKAHTVATTSAPSVQASIACAQLGADLAQLVGPLVGGARPGAAGQDLVGDGGEQRLLVGEVVVDRARLDVELGPEPAHRQRGEAVAVEQGDGVREHVAAVMSHTPSRSSDTVDAAFATTLT